MDQSGERKEPMIVRTLNKRDKGKEHELMERGKKGQRKEDLICAERKIKSCNVRKKVKASELQGRRSLLNPGIKFYKTRHLL